MDRLAPGEGDVLIFLGSYLGPGNNSKGVMDYLLNLKKKPGTYIFLKGCYEFMFENCIGEKQPPLDRLALWAKMGGDKVLRSYAARDKVVIMSPANGGPSKPIPLEIPLHIPEPHLRMIEKEMHYMFQDDVLPFIACHNGYYAGVAGQKMNEEHAVFTPQGWAEDENFEIPGKEIIFSHIPADRVVFGKGKINLDLGAGLGGRLCAMEMYERKLYTTVRGIHG